MASDPLLVIVASAPMAQVGGDRVVLTRKFLEGMREHVRLWPGGRVRVIAEAGPIGVNLDEVEVAIADLPFELALCGFGRERIRPHLADARMALMMLYHRHMHLAEFCRELGVASAFVSEYTLRTRLQINRTDNANPAKRLLKDVVETWRERGLRRAVALANGVQCNGTPTHDVYRKISPAPLLFFDTRVTGATLADTTALDRRFKARRSRGTLHLAFSGRLIPMKGADHLVAVARRLRDLGRSFTLSICGAGTSEPEMRAQAAREGLADRVSFRGVLGFEAELMPFMRDEVDVFVCCHRQGDPSCTYLETMACGVPIAGYANEALAGLHDVSGAGWLSPMDQPDALAAKLAALSDDDIERQSRTSLAFAGDHLLETEFSRRMSHLAMLAGVTPVGS